METTDAKTSQMEQNSQVPNMVTIDTGQPASNEGMKQEQMDQNGALSWVTITMVTITTVIGHHYVIT